jgi:S1-C subfamily serine protease
MSPHKEADSRFPGALFKFASVFVPIALLAGFAYAEQSPNQQDLFEQPRNMESLVEEVRNASYQVFCGDYGGSGWGLKTEYGGEVVEYLVTNEHVIKGCLKKGGVIVEDRWGTALKANIINYWHRDAVWDNSSVEIDFALLEIKGRKLNTLSKLAIEHPIGSWLMTSSYPAIDWETGVYTITTGVISAETYVSGYTTDAPINGGSSGGVVVNSRGEVLGTIYASNDPGEYLDTGLFLDNRTLFEVIAKAQREKSK